MGHPATIVLKYAGPRVAEWFWRECKDMFDATALGPVHSLNRRSGENAGKGYGYRRQPDPNPHVRRAWDGQQNLPRFFIS
jgi:hypothetical protein